MTAPSDIVKNSIILYERWHESWVCHFVVLFLVCCKEQFQRNDMHIIVGFANLPQAVRNTVHGADVILIFVKRGFLEVTASIFRQRLALKPLPGNVSKYAYTFLSFRQAKSKVTLPNSIFR